MWVDMLHSFYTMPIWLYVGGVKQQFTIRWYKAPAGAKPFPYPSAIFSHVWDNNPGESVPGEVGEIGFPRTWDPGQNNGYQGQCFRGDPLWFQTGQLPALDTITPSPCICQVGPLAASGGIVLSGAAAVWPNGLCFHYLAGQPSLDQLDGAGPVPMTRYFSTLVYFLPSTFNPGLYWWAGACSFGGCGGGSGTNWGLFLSATLPTLGFPTALLIQRSGPPPTWGIFQVPQNILPGAGQILTLYNP